MYKSLMNDIIKASLVLLIMIKVSKQECLCDVRFVGGYCGTKLNEKNGNNNCTQEMYYCGKSNLKKEAVVLKACTRPGLGCDSKLNEGNLCYKNLLCRCTPNMRRKQKYCGTEMAGSECTPNVIYRCPMVRRYSPSPEDACPNGCKDGKCIE